MTLGMLRIESFLSSVRGQVRGRVVTDAKDRYFAADYRWRTDATSEDCLLVSRADGRGNEIRIRREIDLDESLVAFFGLYAGDGAKGSEDRRNPGRLNPLISFSQREPNLVRFATDQFRRLFGDSIAFVFSVGEDSVYFMDGTGLTLLRRAHGGEVFSVPPLSTVRPSLNSADTRYL